MDFVEESYPNFCLEFIRFTYLLAFYAPNLLNPVAKLEHSLLISAARTARTSSPGMFFHRLDQ